MVTKEYIEENLLTKSGGLNANKTKTINETSEDLYLIFHNTDKPFCHCGKQLPFINFIKGYRSACSLKCSNNNPLRNEKISKTYSNMTQEKRDLRNKKTEETNLKKYGVKRPSQNDSIKEKTKIHFIETYGVDNPMKLDKHKRFGVDNIFSTFKHEINPMKLPTTKKRTGKDNFFGTEQGKEIVRLKLEEKGLRIPLDQKSDYERYSRQVWIETRKQDINSLKYSEKRGVKGYHLDHRYSILEGFKNNILPSIIGNIKNLEFIPYFENCSKGRKCSVLLNEII